MKTSILEATRVSLTINAHTSVATAPNSEVTVTLAADRKLITSLSQFADLEETHPMWTETAPSSVNNVTLA